MKYALVLPLKIFLYTILFIMYNVVFVSPFLNKSTSRTKITYNKCVYRHAFIPEIDTQYTLERSIN